ncbi:MAG: transcription antitermination factor NusB [Acidimicrobiia bacterium]|nr:transcription antitermination factor NusB [Acidimicrobiia bacterium]
MLLEHLGGGFPDPRPQEGEVTYADKVTPDELRLDWARPAADLRRVVALGAAWTTLDGRRLKVLAAEPVPEGPDLAPGRLDGTLVGHGIGPAAAPPGPARGEAAPRRRGVAARRPTRCRCRARPVTGRTPPDARRLAVDVLARVARRRVRQPRPRARTLERSGLDERDRRFVTELVYGTVRMRRACDWLVDRFLTHPPDDRTREVLRLGAYQLVFMGTPVHAAVDTTVEVAPRRTRGLVNAVLRKVAAAPRDWPNDAVRTSYPDWIVERLDADLGHDTAVAALETMNRPPRVTERADGYVQDEASQWVVDALAPRPSEMIADVCAAPGGKATGARRRWGDRRRRRSSVVSRAAGPGERRAGRRRPVAAGGRRAPPGPPPGVVDAVLVDAPCSGLGVLRRRPDARWRVEPGAVERLARLQRGLLAASVPLLRPGGRLVYSACTLIADETTGIDRWLEETCRACGGPAAARRPVGAGGSGAVRLLRPDGRAPTGCTCWRWRAPGRAEPTGQIPAPCRTTTPPGLRAKILTVSDGVACGDTAGTRAGDAVVSRLAEAGFRVIERRVVRDGSESVLEGLMFLCKNFDGMIGDHGRYRVRRAATTRPKVRSGHWTVRLRGSRRPCGR